jgi:hypothetical protein
MVTPVAAAVAPSPIASPQPTLGLQSTPHVPPLQLPASESAAPVESDIPRHGLLAPIATITNNESHEISRLKKLVDKLRYQLYILSYVVALLPIYVVA